MRRFRDYPVGVKGCAIAGVAVLLLLLIVCVGVYYYQQITSLNQLAGDIQSFEKRAVDARVAEKEWLQFHTGQARQAFDGVIAALQKQRATMVDSTAARAYGTNLAEIESRIAAYTDDFKAAQAIYTRQQTLKSKMTAPWANAISILQQIIFELNKRQARVDMEGISISDMEYQFMNVCRENLSLFYRMQVIQLEFLETKDKNFLAQFEELVAQRLQNNLDSLLYISMIVLEGTYQAQSQEVVAAVDTVKEMMTASLALAEEGQEGIQAVNQSGRNLEKTVAGLLSDVQQAVGMAKHRAQWTLLAIIIAGAVILFGVMFLLIRQMVVVPVKKIDAFAGALRAGDLSIRVNLDSNDEIGRVGKNLDAMARNLEEKAFIASAVAGGDLLQDVTVASDKDQLGMALNDMIMGLSRIVSDINHAMEQMAGSMVALAGQASSNATDAARANQLSSATNSSVQKGASQMTDMTTAMEKISQSSSEIGNIIKTIDEIAFQTNLLALNAAVEAARAGEHGTGFAVVAEEVRNLAQRSAKAAQETAGLIEDAIQNATDGTTIVEKTSQAFDEIKANSAKTDEILEGIAAASNEQKQSIGQENSQTVSLRDHSFRQESVGEDQNTMPSTGLLSQVAHVRRLLEKFRLQADMMEDDRTQAGRGMIINVAQNGWQTRPAVENLFPE
ncbi:MAG: methyl-accepting chemotaxis protein [Thermodesulfobacteriota bacterium]|nr:methyl-accepting chemotaxis protein [Thermodesulfobacteriota bacterium]